MPTSYLKEKETALKAVFQATALAMQMQDTLEALDVISKEDLSPVTITDFSLQALLNFHLSHAFPSDEIMGEEDSLFLRDPQNRIIKEKVVHQIQRIYPKMKEHDILAAIDRGGSKGGPRKRFWVLD